MSDNKSKPAVPEPERAQVGGGWLQTVGKALKQKKPAAGWPEPPGRYGNKKTRLKSR